MSCPGVGVSYYDESNVWPIVFQSIADRLPLKHVEWTNRVGVTQIIPEIAIDFYPQNDRRWIRTVENDDRETMHWYRDPFLHIYVVKCEEIDVYRNQVRPQLQKWLETMRQEQNEWLIVYVPIGTRTPVNQNTALSILRGTSSDNSVYKKIYDKIRTEFHQSKEGDRSFKVEMLHGGGTIAGAAPGQQQQHDSQWSQFLVLLRQGVMASFEHKSIFYEQQTRQLEAQRSNEGWDFYAFLMMKESLAIMYQQTQLYDDAIRHYDELEAIATSLVPDSFVLPAKDQSFDAIMDLEFEAVQSQISSRSISNDEFRLYLFARQIIVLLQKKDGKEILNRLDVFIPSFIETIEKRTNDSNKALIWSLETLLGIATVAESQYKLPEACLADLFYRVRIVLLRAKAANCSIILSIDLTEESQYNTYMHELALKLSKYCEKAGRWRFAAKLRSVCIDFYLSSGQNELAEGLLKVQLREYSKEKWNRLTQSVLERLTPDPETTLALLKLQLSDLNQFEILLERLKGSVCSSSFDAFGKIGLNSTHLQIYSRFPRRVSLHSLTVEFKPDIVIQLASINELSLNPGLNTFPIDIHLSLGTYYFVKCHVVIEDCLVFDISSSEMFDYDTLTLRQLKMSQQDVLTIGPVPSVASDMIHIVPPALFIPGNTNIINFFIEKQPVDDVALLIETPNDIQLDPELPKVKKVMSDSTVYKMDQIDLRQGFNFALHLVLSRPTLSNCPLSISLVDKKQQYLAQSSVRVPIGLPFKSQVKLHHSSSDRVTVEIALTCNDHCPIQLLDYEFESPVWIDTAANEADLSEFMLQEMKSDLNAWIFQETLYPRDIVHVVLQFHCQFPSTTGMCTDGTIKLIYSCVQDEERHEYAVQFSLTPNPEIFSIEWTPVLACVPFYYEGTFVQFQLRIQHHENKTERTNEYKYRIESSADWMVSGKQQAWFSFDASGQYATTCQLLPVRTGHLHLPTISINSKAFVVPIQIQIYPTGAFSSGLLNVDM